jgi:hypothetical protein
MFSDIGARATPERHLARVRTAREEADATRVAVNYLAVISLVPMVPQWLG